LFFQISKQIEDNFPNHFHLDNIVVNTDQGWIKDEQEDSIVIYKGYADYFAITDLLQNYHTTTGNYCLLQYNKQNKTLQILTDQYRSFTMWYQPGEFVGNLKQTPHALWASNQISINNQLEVDITYLSSNDPDVIGTINTDTITYDECLDNVHAILQNKITSFLQHNKLPVKCFLSGGIDSLLVYSYITSITENFSNVFFYHQDWDYFWCHNESYIRNHFNFYNQIHHWVEPCVLSTGACGDEYFFRNPQLTDIWLSWHGLRLKDFTASGDRYSQAAYYNKKTYNNDKEIEEVKCLTKKELIEWMCNRQINDCQHWHLGNTLTYTPLRDLKIYKEMARLNPKQLSKQITSNQFSIDLVCKNNSGLIDYLSTDKNTGETTKNLYKLMSKQAARSGQ